MTRYGIFLFFSRRDLKQKSPSTESSISKWGSLVETEVEIPVDPTLRSPHTFLGTLQTVLCKHLQMRTKATQLEPGKQKHEREEHRTLELEIAVFLSQTNSHIVWWCQWSDGNFFLLYLCHRVVIEIKLYNMSETLSNRVLGTLHPWDMAGFLTSLLDNPSQIC